MMKIRSLKTVAIGLVAAMIMVVLPSMLGVDIVSDAAAAGHVITVDDSGGADYLHIQDAIDAASNGDIIYVYSGVYNENIIVDKSIKIIGEEKDTTIIDGMKKDSVVKIEAPHVFLTGFTLTSSASDTTSSGVFITRNGYNSLILNNRIHRCTNGIRVYSNNVTIMKNEITTPIYRYGIYLAGDLHNPVLNNNIVFNKIIEDQNITYALALYHSHHNVLRGNTIGSIIQGVGIFLYNSTHNIISDCNILNNRGGIYIEHSSNNTISNCNILDNGIGIYLPYSPNTIIENCVITRCGSGVNTSSDADHTKIINCEISNNSHWGVFLAYAKSFIVTNCEIKYNHMGVAIWPCDSSTVKNCNISNNNYGVYIPSGEWIGGWRYNYSNMIYHNNFVDNTVQAYDAENNIWDNGYPSGGNYWSDYNGSDNDGDGIGDTPYYVPGGSSRDRYPLMQPWNGSLPTPDISFVADDVDDTITVTSISPAGVSWSNVRVECYNDSNQSAVIPMNGTIEAGDVIDVKKAGLYGNVTVRITWLPTNTLLAEFNLYIQPLHPDVEIEKYVKDKVTGEWVNYENVTIGDIATFKLKITNTGDTLLTICQVLDYLPHGLEYQGTTDTPPDYPIEWVFNDVPPGESVYVVFTAKATTLGEKINLARVIAVDENQNTMQDEDTAIVYVAQPPQFPDICSKKVWDPINQTWVENLTAQVGDTVRFNITITNPSDTYTLYNITVKDTLPPGLDYANNANPTETSVVGNIIYWSLTTPLPPGETTHIEFDATVTEEGTHINTANVTANECTGRTVYCEDNATVNTLPSQPNVSVEKYVKHWYDDEWYKYINCSVDDLIEFKLICENTGDTLLTNLSLADYLPDGVLFEGNASIPPGYVENHTLLWWFNDLLPGESIEIELQVRACSSGDYINLLTVSAQDEFYNGVYQNDSAEITIVQLPNPDVFIGKYVRNQVSNVWKKHVNVSVGDYVKFKLVCNNTGNTVLDNLTIIDFLPSGLSYVNAAPEPNVVDDDGDLYWCPVFVDGFQRGATITIEVTALAEDDGEYLNVACVYAHTGYETIGSNDSAGVHIHYPPQPGVSIEKYVKDVVTDDWVKYENITIGDIATFKLRITNTGETLLINCSVTDYLPEGLEYQGTTNNIPDTTINWGFNNVPPGESVYVIFTAEATTVGEKINLARVIAVDENQNTMQDEDTAIVYVAQPPQPNVSIEKYVRSQESSVWQKHVNVSLDDQVHFKLVCSNIGNVPLENFSVIDYLPTGLTYADNATPKEPDHMDGNKLYWNFRNIYPGATITVEFTAVAESTGEHRNIAYVYTPVSSGEIVYSNDTATVNVFIQDTTPPVTTAKLSGVTGSNGWYVSDVVVTLNAVDDASGVSHTFYRLFHIKTLGILQWQEYTEPFMVTNEGRFTLEFYSVDNAGNVEKIKSAKFKIDKTPPKTTHHIRKLGRKIIVSLEAFDGVSGVDRTFYSVDGGRFRVYRCPFFLSSGVQHQVRYYSVDQAGNREPVKVIVIEDNPVPIPPPPWVIPP